VIKKLQDFFIGVRFEMKKVSWPSWEELRGSTMVVFGLTLILGIFLFIVDLILSRIINAVL